MAQEGLIQYQLNFAKKAIEMPKNWQALNTWRRILVSKKVLGQDDNRYTGLGFGNVSLRTGTKSFIITASQTGDITDLTEQHYSQVTNWDIKQNKITATGLIKPSSESLTHAQIYQLDDSIQAVFHGHSPDIWQQYREICTDEKATFGTVAMAKEFERLYKKNALKSGRIVSLLGHTDGFITYGRNLDEAGNGILTTL